MKQEGEIREDMSAAQFRDQFFLHAVASQNPRLYHELYADVDAPEQFEIPGTPEELQAMIAELSQVGVDLNVTLDEVRPDRPSYEDQFDVRPAQNPWNA